MIKVCLKIFLNKYKNNSKNYFNFILFYNFQKFDKLKLIFVNTFYN